MRVLGIESSCDDTGCALYDLNEGLLAHRLASQVDVHARYGGVVPELAARDHIRVLLPLIEAVLEDAGLTRGDIDAIAYTSGPGLVGALLVGAVTGRSLAYSLGVPAVGVHHMEGHLLSPMLDTPDLEYPFVALLVSGGHTLLADVAGPGRYRVLGASLDDAAGEAFDKTAKLLGLGYPGGPVISKRAEAGTPDRFRLPRPMTDRPGLDFSFSGLKTAVVQLVEPLQAEGQLDDQTIADVCYAFQDAVVDTLAIKCDRALQFARRKQLVVAGGVGANAELRRRLVERTEKRGAKVFYPRPEFCTDNGAMIAYAGALRLASGSRADLAVDVSARWNLADLPPMTSSPN